MEKGPLGKKSPFTRKGLSLKVRYPGVFPFSFIQESFLLLA